MARKARPDRARLTREDVVEIRKQVSEGESQSDLARLLLDAGPRPRVLDHLPRLRFLHP